MGTLGQVTSVWQCAQKGNMVNEKSNMVKDMKINEGTKRPIRRKWMCKAGCRQLGFLLFSNFFILHAGLCKNGQNVTEDPSARLSKL